MVQQLNMESYAQAVGSKLPIMIDFYTDWCGHCKKIAPVVEEVSEKQEGKALFYKVDVDAEPELARQFQVSVIPTLAVLKNGQTVAKASGFMEKEQLLKLLEKA